MTMTATEVADALITLLDVVLAADQEHANMPATKRAYIESKSDPLEITEASGALAHMSTPTRHWLRELLMALLDDEQLTRRGGAAAAKLRLVAQRAG